jgi:uncharacterized protein (DUF427 family)
LVDRRAHHFLSQTIDTVTTKRVRITHGRSCEIAEGPIGWGVTPFEGGWYIRDRYVRTDGFRLTPIPGLCSYKFLHLWLDFRAKDGSESKRIGWKYVLPNPFLPFIAFRVAVPSDHPDLIVEVLDPVS